MLQKIYIEDFKLLDEKTMKEKTYFKATHYLKAYDTRKGKVILLINSMIALQNIYLT
ncbi:hypothetical protein [Helicobacter turcicus]|uniref:hypothetical protein n=1 Tax=Helicobacter turcicus TaxID=2867412 RepID=UPI001F2B82BA|nr:hypothetical protein [Helicobacter turcicus]